MSLITLILLAILVSPTGAQELRFHMTHSLYEPGNNIDVLLDLIGDKGQTVTSTNTLSPLPPCL